MLPLGGIYTRLRYEREIATFHSAGGTSVAANASRSQFLQFTSDPQQHTHLLVMGIMANDTEFLPGYFFRLFYSHVPPVQLVEFGPKVIKFNVWVLLSTH